MGNETSTLNIPFSEYKTDLLNILEEMTRIKEKYNLKSIMAWDNDSEIENRIISTSTGNMEDSFSNLFNFSDLKGKI